MHAGPQVVISYRREPTLPTASRIYDHLKLRLGPKRVFMDHSSIHVGEDFMTTIEKAIVNASVVLAVIGPGWAAALGRPDDYVRRELETANRHGVAILPVLVDGARMPAPGELPEHLASIVETNAASVRHTDFEIDMDELVGAVRKRMRSSRNDSRPFLWGALALAIAAAGIWRGPVPRQPTSTSGAPRAENTSPSAAGQDVYCVVAGTFASFDNAARQLEQFQRNGYQRATLRKDRLGRFVVALDCTSDRESARAVLETARVREGAADLQIVNSNSLTPVSIIR